LGAWAAALGAPIRLPVVDLHNASAPRDLRAACETYGAFRVRGHELTPERIAAARDVADDFFKQSADAKKRVPKIDGAGDPRGYSWFEAENVGAMAGMDTPPDPIEKFSIGIDSNVWPPDGDLESVGQRFFDDAQSLARKVFPHISVAEGLPPDFFDSYLTASRDSMRLLHYPAIPSERLRMQPHTDMGVFTLIFPDGPGLEYLVDNTWRPVESEPGDVIVHVGDALATLTGSYRSNIHRVASHESSRSSIVFFQRLNDDTPMRRLGDDAAAPAMTYGEYHATKMHALATKETEGTTLKDAVYREHLSHFETGAASDREHLSHVETATTTSRPPLRPGLGGLAGMFHADAPKPGPKKKVLISSGSTFEADIGYSRAVVIGDRVLVSGTTGFDYATMTISDDIVEQTKTCIQNLDKALETAGATLDDVVRVRYMLPSASDFPQTWPVLREAFGVSRPAATMIESGLADKRMLIEIEVEAVIGAGANEPERRRTG